PTLADNFKTVDPAWQLDPNTTYYVDGQLALKALEDKSVTRGYSPLRFKNVTVCADIRSPIELSSLESTASAGIVFWEIDVQNLYLASVYTNGAYAIFRKAGNSWLPAITPRTPFASIKPGAGAVNELQVTTNGNNGVLSINGVKVQEFRGQPPKDN